MGRERATTEIVKDLSLGVLDTFVDFGLFIVAFWAQGYALGSGRKDIFEALSDSAKFIKAVKKEYLKGGFYTAAKKGFLRKTNEGNWEVTAVGGTRLDEVLPKYHSKRPWDGKIYLITYDIPEKMKKVRDLLREYLKRMRCGMFQASVWLTPYNPKKILAEFILERKLLGFVVVSDIGKDGNVGQMSIRELVREVYELDKLNERYADFLKEAEQGELPFWEVKMLFLSVLKDDPQLPFELLSGNWVGDKAHESFSKMK